MPAKLNTVAKPRDMRFARPASDVASGEPGLSHYAGLAARYGQTGIAPFLAHPDIEVVDLLGGDAAGGYVSVRQWAVSPGDVIGAPEVLDLALAEYLAVLSARRLRPAFVAVADPLPYIQLGMYTEQIADEAIIHLPGFSLAGSKRANLRHSAASARRMGLTVVPYAPSYGCQIQDISDEWLRTKRGGELGFTLSRHCDVDAQRADHSAEVWLIVDSDGTVQAWCTWRPYLDGQARVLDIMRRRVTAPNPAMDCLLVTVLENYRDAGLLQASLASVPRDRGSLAEHIYPTRGLRAYKQKFQPLWCPRWLAIPAAWQKPLAYTAIGTAYRPDVLRRAARRNR